MPRSPNGDEFTDIDGVTAVLNRIDDYSALGKLQLAQGRLVSQELSRRAEADTPFQRGRILSRIIRDEVSGQVDRLRHGHGPHTAEWTILHYRINEGYSIDDAARFLSIPRRTVGRYYRRAKELLLDTLYEREAGLLQATLYCPLCGALLSAVPINGEAIFQCSGCDASIEVAPAPEQDRWRLSVRRPT